MNGTKVQKRLFAVLLCGLLCLNGNTLLAQQIELPEPDLTYKHHRMASQIGPNLLELYDDYSTFQDEGEGDFKPSFDLLMIENGQVKIHAIAKPNRTDELVNQLLDLGLKKPSSFMNAINGSISILSIPDLYGLDALKYIRCVYRPISKSGSVVSQGDEASESDDARTTFSTTGAGITVGILSDSYNTLSGEAAGIASGDLPVGGVTVEQEYSSTGIDEGRAMAEIIHDLAPGADMIFRTAFEGEADFAQGILDLQTAGCDIIVDDIGYFAEPFFQDGLIAQAVNTVSAAGIPYFSAAGNSGDSSYEVDGFVDSGTQVGGGATHDFDSGSGVDFSQLISVPPGVTLYITLQWDDPYGNLPGAVSGADTDLDIYLYNSSLSSVRASSVESNIVTGDPYEILSYTNNSGSTRNLNVVITLYDGPAPTKMKWLAWSDNITINEYDTQSSTCIGHANAAGAMAVGASAYYNTPAFGVSPAAINSFSAKGGTPILFDDVGNSITEVIRERPDFVAPDGTNTTFFGTDTGVDADTDPNFFGTSAAAPHAAAMAALVMEEFPATTPEQIRTLFRGTAIDMGTAGYDFETGAGLMHTYNAIDQYANVLAFELLSFGVKPTEKGALLNWVTSLERDNEGFIVQMARSNFDWQDMGFIRGAGDSETIQEYSFDIPFLANGTYYFRLQQRDFDGTLHTSGIKSIRITDNPFDFSAYAALSEGALYLEFPEAWDGTAGQVRIFDVAGKALINFEVEPNWSNAQFRIPIQGLPKGVYIIQVQNGDFFWSEKLVF